MHGFAQKGDHFVNSVAATQLAPFFAGDLNVFFFPFFSFSFFLRLWGWGVGGVGWGVGGGAKTSKMHPCENK